MNKLEKEKKGFSKYHAIWKKKVGAKEQAKQGGKSQNARMGKQIGLLLLF